MLQRNVCVPLRILKTACVQGKVVQALQCAQRHKLTSLDPEAFLSKAAETGVFMLSAGRNNVRSLDCKHCIPCQSGLQQCCALQPTRWLVLMVPDDSPRA